jgi:hypothetical protein
MRENRKRLAMIRSNCWRRRLQQSWKGKCSSAFAEDMYIATYRRVIHALSTPHDWK